MRVTSYEKTDGTGESTHLFAPPLVAADFCLAFVEEVHEESPGNEVPMTMFGTIMEMSEFWTRIFTDPRRLLFFGYANQAVGACANCPTCKPEAPRHPDLTVEFEVRDGVPWYKCWAGHEFPDPLDYPKYEGPAMQGGLAEPAKAPSVAPGPVACPKCQAPCIKAGTRRLLDGAIVQRLRCQACDHRFTQEYAGSAPPRRRPGKVTPEVRARILVLEATQSARGIARTLEAEGVTLSHSTVQDYMTPGRPRVPPPPRPVVDAMERFWAKVSKGEGDACWLWTGAVEVRTGYAVFKVEGVKVNAHRFAYERLIGPIPPRHDVGHSCEAKTCVRPEHLLTRTRRETRANAKTPAPELEAHAPGACRPPHAGPCTAPEAPPRPERRSHHPPRQPPATATCDAGHPLKRPGPCQVCRLQALVPTEHRLVNSPEGGA